MLIPWTKVQYTGEEVDTHHWAVSGGKDIRYRKENCRRFRDKIQVDFQCSVIFIFCLFLQADIGCSLVFKDLKNYINNQVMYGEYVFTPQLWTSLSVDGGKLTLSC